MYIFGFALCSFSCPGDLIRTRQSFASCPDLPQRRQCFPDLFPALLLTSLLAGSSGGSHLPASQLLHSTQDSFGNSLEGDADLALKLQEELNRQQYSASDSHVRPKTPEFIKTLSAYDYSGNLDVEMASDRNGARKEAMQRIVGISTICIPRGSSVFYRVLSI